MRRKLSAQSFKSDSGAEDYTEDNDDETIFMADATSSGETSDLEKESSRRDEIHEGTSLLPRRLCTYGGVSIKGDKIEEEAESQSVPDIIYASPRRPHLPSPSASNSRLPGTFFYPLTKLISFLSVSAE